MIIHNPAYTKRKDDIKQYGDWHWCWCRRIGDFLVVCNWVRRQVEHSGNTYIITWRKPDNVILHSETCTDTW